GGGTILSPAGACRADQSLTGRANFGFVSKYEPGAKTPSGNAEFKFQVASFTFKSTSYDWLAVSAGKAQYKGSGTVNGIAGYSFLLTAYDGDPTGGPDKFRIKIWKTSDNTLVYDNRLNAPDDLSGADPPAIASGRTVD